MGACGEGEGTEEDGVGGLGGQYPCPGLRSLCSAIHCPAKADAGDGILSEVAQQSAHIAEARTGRGGRFHNAENPCIHTLVGGEGDFNVGPDRLGAADGRVSTHTGCIRVPLYCRRIGSSGIISHRIVCVTAVVEAGFNDQAAYPVPEKGLAEGVHIPAGSFSIGCRGKNRGETALPGRDGGCRGGANLHLKSLQGCSLDGGHIESQGKDVPGDPAGSQYFGGRDNHLVAGPPPVVSIRGRVACACVGTGPRTNDRINLGVEPETCNQH